MAKVKIVGFEKNIVKEVMENENLINSTFVFNNQREVSEALFIRQKKWDFTESEMLVFSEWKENILFTEFPILKEDRRLIAFYNSLSKENKDFFNISDYFQSIKFSYKFFKFWEEFHENLLSDKILIEKFENKEIFEQETQLKMYKRLKLVKKSYLEYLGKKGFTDNIFQLERLQIEKKYENLIFIDIRGFSKLDKYIFNKLEENGCKITIYFWGNSEMFDEKKYEIKSFEYKDIPNLINKITVHIDNNGNNSFLNFLEHQEENKIERMIDFNFEKSPYYHILNTDYFDLGSYEYFKNSSIYIFFSTLNSLFHSIIWERKGKKHLIPIFVLIKSLKEKTFAKYFLEQNADESLIDETIEFLTNLWDNNLRYLDISNVVLKKYKKESKIYNYLRGINGFLHSLMSTKSIKKFCDDIGENEPIEISKIISKEEISQYNYLELFYQTLSDFSVIEDVLNLKNWEKMFPLSKFKDKNIALPQGIIRLFLEYIKSKKSSFEYVKKSQKIKVSEFDKTDYFPKKKIAIMNLIENNLQGKKPDLFFWTENQREKLGLETRKDLSYKNKYSLGRIISMSEYSHLYTYEDSLKDIEISSFVEELILDVEGIEICHIEDDYSYKNIGNTIFQNTLEISKKENYDKDKKFYSFDFDKSVFEKAFSYYSFSLFLKNPFRFYLDYLGIKEMEVSGKDSFSPKFLGEMIHRVLNNNWKRIILLNGNEKFKHDFIKYENKKNLEKSFDSYIVNDSLFYFRSPHDFSAKYFDLIIKPLIIENSTYFFKKFAEKFEINNKKIKVFPEENYTEIKGKVVFPKNNKIFTDIKIKVRADLRVESDNYKIIIDYKTGLSSYDQLIIYELYFYNNFDNVKSAIFSFFDKNFDKEINVINREKKREKLIDKLEKTLELVKNFGFTLHRKNQDKYDIEELSRTDLFKKGGQQ